MSQIGAAAAVIAPHYNFSPRAFFIASNARNGRRDRNRSLVANVLASFAPIREARCMTDISSGVAFWIFDAWRKVEAQLQVVSINGALRASTPAVIWHTFPIASKISMVILLDDGQKREWELPLADAKFSFGTVGECAVFPEFAEGKWVSFLVADLPSGTQMLFAERFVDGNAIDKDVPQP
jgi:hypothetical protein